MRRMLMALALAAVATGASARHGYDGNDPAAVAKALAGRVAGTPTSCIDPSRIDGPEIIDQHTILYRQTGRRTWRTGPVGACPSLRPLTTLITEIYGSQMCRNDRFRVLEPGTTIPSGYCRFADFVPYDKPRR